MSPRKKSEVGSGKAGKAGKSKKSTKREIEAQFHAVEQELRLRIANVEGENVLLHEKNLDLTNELAASKKKLEDTQLSLTVARESTLQLTPEKQLPIVQEEIELPARVVSEESPEFPVDDEADSSDSSDENSSSSSDDDKGWEENFFDKKILEELQQEVDCELAARKKVLKSLRKQKKPLEYTLQYTPAENISKLMKSKWTNEFLVKHKMTNEPSKRGASTKVPMMKREKNLLLSTIKKAWSQLDSLDMDRAASLLVGRVFNNARPKVRLS